MSEDFVPLKELTENREIVGMKYVRGDDRLVVSLLGEEVKTLRVEISNELGLSHLSDEKDVALIAHESSGILMTKNGKFFSTASKDAESPAFIQQEEESPVEFTVDEVRKMTIDADNVTFEDIETYEKLMLGAVTLASSNANHKVGLTEKDIYAKHTWTRDASTTDDIGTFELAFE